MRISDIKQSYSWYIVVFVAMLLSISLFPAKFNFYVPWLMLVVIYSSIYLNLKFTVYHAWFLGVVLDLLLGTLLGQSALAFSIVCFLSIKLARRFKFLDIVQQLLIIFCLVLIGQSIVIWLQYKIGNSMQSIVIFKTALIGALLWLPLSFLLRKILLKNSQSYIN